MRTLHLYKKDRASLAEWSKLLAFFKVPYKGRISNISLGRFEDGVHVFAVYGEGEADITDEILTEN